jgi:hypothetical protein
MNNRKLVLILVVIAMALLVVDQSDYEDEMTQRQHYCEMVELWHDHDHLPPEQRPGWPPYKGGCDGQD